MKSKMICSLSKKRNQEIVRVFLDKERERPENKLVRIGHLLALSTPVSKLLNLF